jgi:Sec-independent protein translocase protein TatA
MLTATNDLISLPNPDVMQKLSHAGRQLNKNINGWKHEMKTVKKGEDQRRKVKYIREKRSQQEEKRGEEFKI